MDNLSGHVRVVRRAVALSDTGRRIGDSNPMGARWSDDLVKLARDLHEIDGLGYRRIARFLTEEVGRVVPFNTVKDWCAYVTRAEVPKAWKFITTRENASPVAETPVGTVEGNDKITDE